MKKRNGSDSSYAIGYGKPPVGSQFPPGQSGNLKGRPKGSRNISNILRDILDETVIANLAGEKKLVTYREGIARVTVAKALKGDDRATNRVFEVDSNGETRETDDMEAERRRAILFAAMRPLHTDAQMSNLGFGDMIEEASETEHGDGGQA